MKSILSILTIIAAFLLSVSNAEATPQHCYSDGEAIALQGAASAKPLTMADSSVKAVWILTATMPLCVIERNIQQIRDVSQFQIIGSPPPADTLIELKGTLIAGTITEPSAILVTSGRRIFSTSAIILDDHSPQPVADIQSSAQISCKDLEYGNPNYHDNMDKLAVLAKLPNAYWSRYHDDVVGFLCKGITPDIAAINDSVDYGYVPAQDAEAIAQVLGKTYKAIPRTAKGMTFERVNNGLENLGLCHVCAGGIADEYLKNPTNDLAKLSDAALSGDKDALSKLQSIKDYSSYVDESHIDKDKNDTLKISTILPFLIFIGVIYLLRKVKIGWGWLLFGAIIIFILANVDSKEKTPAEKACADDWKKCSDNSQLVNNYNNFYHIRYQCRQSAINMAKYGTPEFPSYVFFGSFHKGSDYIETGIVSIYESDAKFQNGFGAMVHSNVTCQYDLNKNEVISVDINPN